MEIPEGEAADTDLMNLPFFAGLDLKPSVNATNAENVSRDAEPHAEVETDGEVMR